MTSPERGSGQPTAPVTSETSGEAAMDSSAPESHQADQESLAPGVGPDETTARVWNTEPNKAEADQIAETEEQDVQAKEQTLVIEDGVVSKRLRRPMDLVRLIVAVAACVTVAAFAYFATTATSSLGADVSAASQRLPGFLSSVLSFIALIGLFVLPVAATVDLLVRGRGRQLLDAFIGLVVAVVIVEIAQGAIEYLSLERWQIALAGSPNTGVTPLLALFAGVVAFITVARLMARVPWNGISIIVVISLGVLPITAGTNTLVGVALSLLIGWACGLLTRYALGTPTTRPSGVKVAQTLERAGIPVVVLRATEITDIGRHYLATQVSGPPLDVIVLDRDLEGAGLIQQFWRTLRLRQESGDRAFNMRRSLEQRALLAYAAANAGITAPRLLAAREVSADSSLLAYEQLPGRVLADMKPEEISDEMLDNIWMAAARLRNAGIAHRKLNSHNILIRIDGSAELRRLNEGTVAASDVALRIDLAELLCSLGLLVGAERAVSSGRRTLGSSVIATALPVLQPVAFSSVTKKAIRKDKDLLIAIRDSLIEAQQDASVEHIELERIKPRTVVMIVLLTIAIFFLVSQVSQFRFDELADPNWYWVVPALLASLVTYPAAAWSLSGFVPEKLRLVPTTGAQLAGDFATLVAPPTLGAVAINLRYLQKVGIHPALATASIGVSQVGAFVVHILLLIGFGVVTGTRNDFSQFVPSRVVLIVIVVTIILISVLALLKPVRQMVWQRIGPMMKEVIPRLVTVAQRPWKLFEGVGGILLLNLGYIACLSACVMAYTDDVSIPAVAVVYLTASVIGQAAPTPGGIGAVEGALFIALTTVAGLAAGPALSAVLLYRLITFFLPTLPGYLAFNLLQKKGYL